MPSITDNQIVALAAKGQTTGSLADRQYAYLLGANPRTNSRNDLLRIRGDIPKDRHVIIPTP